MWLDDCSSPQTDINSNGVQNHSPQVKLIEAYLMFLFLWQTTFRLSDVGITVLLGFVATFVLLLARTFGLQALKEFASHLPRTVHAARKLLGRGQDSFTKWVCCPSCSSLYRIEECMVSLPDGSKSSRRCSYIQFPDHPQVCRRKPCDTLLMKTVRTSTGTTYLYPRQMYCYNSLVRSLKERVHQTGFIDKCEAWRNRVASQGVLEDVFDGQIWEEFMNPEGIPFLSLPYNFALSLNCDWFQPFKNSVHSIGVIYLAVLNLPRAERFTTENIILLGIIPGPKEPEKTINSFLKPLVEELLQLWDGIVMRTHDNRSVLVRAALLCVACDIPAARKVCGFCGHQALFGCSKCLKRFVTDAFGQKADYSGFNRDDWEPRNLDKHKEFAIKHQAAKTQAQRKVIEREHGCRYSVLLQLPYFNPIRMCVIDPMHNLLLGTAKHMLSVWKDLDLITNVHLKNIQEKVDNFITPDDIGRIPSKIASGFSSFTADQWRNWTIIFSLYALRDILPHRHYNCWQLFVKACYLLCRRTITLQQLQQADDLVMEFCAAFELLYGKNYCSINLHLHGHLAECVRDYGPVYAFWLFAFERLNGVLGSFHTNCRDISLQLMRRFLDTNEFGIHNWPSDFKDDLSPLIMTCFYNKGSLVQSSLKATLTNVNHLQTVQPMPPLLESALEPHQKLSLTLVVTSTDLVSETEEIEFLTIFQKCAALKVGSYILGSVDGRYKSSSLIMANSLQDSNMPVLSRIHYFARCTCRLKQANKTETFWFAAVSHFCSHQCQVWFGHPTELWTRVLQPDMHFLPLSFFHSRVAYTTALINFGQVIGSETVYVVVPV